MILQPVRSIEDCQHNFDQIQKQGIYAGVGAPTFFVRQTSYYFRQDTPATLNQRIYVCPAGSANWTGIL